MKFLQKFILHVSLTTFLLTGLAHTAEKTAVVRDGAPVGTIVVPDGSSDQVRKAAEFLRDTVAKSTGATLPIQTSAGDLPAIHLGASTLVPKEDLKDLGRSGFVARRLDAKNFVIAGAHDWGTEFGVYDFLERHLGVRWLAPTELFTEIPKHQTVLLPEGDLKEIPVFLAREFYPMEIESDPNDKARSSGPLWYRLGDEWGRVNRLLADVSFHHNLEFLFPPSKFGESNPEFYPILNGKRMVPPDDKYFQWQPNFSAPGIVEAAAKEIDAYFQANPEKNSYSFGINDSYRFDESEESKARRSGRKNSINLEDISDDYYQWTNDVVALVHQKYPDKVFGLLAYLQVIDPPTRVKVDPAIVPYITYENTRWDDPVYRDAMQKVTLAWGEAAPVLGWYDYVYGSLYLVPRHFPHAEQKALIWGAENKVKYYYAEAMPNWGEGANLWVLTKLLWNPRQDVDALLDDWYTAAVGSAAAPKLKEYYQIWEKFWESDVRSTAWYKPLILWQDFDSTDYLLAVPDEYLERSNRLVDEAVELADTPVRKERAEVLRKMWKIYRASVLARKAADLWKTADLQNEKQVAEYLAKVQTAIKDSEDRLVLLGELAEDPLLGHSVFRYTMSWMRGDDWGASALWPLAPWVKKDPKVRKFLEDLANRKPEDQVVSQRLTYEGLVPLTHQAPAVAAQVLAVGEGKIPQLLQNASFEDGLESWSEGPYEVTDKQALHGKSSLRVASSEDSAVVQNVPYAPGTYVARISAMAGEGWKDGKIRLLLTAKNDEVSQIGIELPTTEVALHPGKWSTLMVPFSLGKWSVDATDLKVEVRFEGLSDKNVVYLDDFGVYRVDEQEAARATAGPDGE